MASTRNNDTWTCGGYGDGKPGSMEKKTWANALKRKTSQWLPTLPHTYSPFQAAEDLLDTGRRARLAGGSRANVANDTEAWHKAHMKHAKSGKEWRRHAEQLDILQGNDYWKIEDEAEEYDVELVRERLAALKEANNDSDMEAMLAHIRNHLKRDLGGMCDPKLYEHSHIGTKYLIDEYTEVVKYTIERLVKYCESDPSVDVGRYHAVMQSAKQSFGKTALMLSGGGTLGMCHIGVVKALLEAGLLPNIVCGASAGSIVGSVLCTQKRDIIADKLEELQNGDLKVFQSDDEMQGWTGAFVNIARGDSAFRVSNLCRVMRNLLGDITFKEAYNYTQMVLNIHVSCKEKHNLPRLLNYITSPNVIIWTAVASSCALPWVFEAPGLKCKNPTTGKIEPWGHLDHKYIDGSIQGDLPSEILERLFNVNNFIACQVNPHIRDIMDRLPLPGNAALLGKLIWSTINVSKTTVVFMLDNLMEYMDPFYIKMLHSVITQRYDGDINVLPEISWVGVSKILANPTHEFMKRATRYGEQATWPRLDRIRNTVAIELSLERAVRDMHAEKLMKDKDPRIRKHRAASSTRSERGFSRGRASSLGFDGAVPRLARGRRAVHAPVRSMVEPLHLWKLGQPQAINDANPLSSSDEITSGQSSPTTSYEDEDFEDFNDRNGSGTPAGIDVRDAGTRLRAFLSQPVSPSISFKTGFFDADANHNPQVPPSPDLRRAMNGLQMSSIDSSIPSPERKRARS